MKKIGFFFCLVLFLAVIAGGCDREETPTADPENGYYTIYYRGVSYQTVTAVEQTEAQETNQIAEELFLLMKNPDEELDAVSVFPEQVSLWQVHVEQQVLYLYFTNNYLDMDMTESVLCQSALARTMTQIPGVEFISIYTGNQPLMDKNGAPIGNLSASDFVRVVGRDINTIEHASLTLYFANETGSALVGEELEVTYSNTASVEEFVLERLIAGPEEGGMKKVMPDGTSLLGISVRDGVCYVNLSTEFLSPLADVSGEVSLYAVVNSLTSLGNITQVQFSVDGSTDVQFGGISLSEPFFRNLDFIQGEEGEDVWSTE